MTDSLDPTVRQILADIGTHGGATGVSFHQRPGPVARYPTERSSPRCACWPKRAKDSAMAAGLRAMLEQVDPNLPIEIEFAGSGPLPCITEGTDQHGFWWRYTPSEDEPGENLVLALRMAGEIASREARTSGNTYLVASATQPSPSVHVFACDHPEAGKADIDIMFEFLPDGRRLRREEGGRP